MQHPQQQQQRREWWQQGPVAPACALLQGFQHNLQWLAAAAPWNQQQRQQQQQLAAASPPPQQQQQQQQRHRDEQHGPHARGGRGAAASASAAPQPVTREELGRATWVFLHTLAAQFPERPTRQQQRDARNLVDCLTRIYPCADCARHFAEIVKADPPTVSSGADFQAWMCRTHNTVNRSIGKPVFNCDLAAARWAPLDCDDEAAAGGGRACDMAVGAAGGSVAAASGGRRRR